MEFGLGQYLTWAVFKQRMDKIELDVNTMKTMIQEMKTMMAQAHSLQIKQTEVSKGKWNALGQD